MRTKEHISLFNQTLIFQAVKESIIKLNPALLIKNPVIFIVGIGALLTTIIVIFRHFSGIIFLLSTFRSQSGCGLPYYLQIFPKPSPKAGEKHRLRTLKRTAHKQKPAG